MVSAGEAQATSAGEQAAEEYLAGDSSRRWAGESTGVGSLD